MKRLLIIVLVLFGLQTSQAQTSGPMCDDMEISVVVGDSWYVTLGIDLELNLPQGSTGIEMVKYEWDCILTCGTNVSEDTDSTTSFFTDTLETYYICTSVEYSVLYEWGAMCYVCEKCNTLVWEEEEWKLYPMGYSTTSIQEVETYNVNNGKIYDLLGKELSSIPKGTIYIQNNKKYIWK